jgi:exopolysaccharide biosynthesis polyprenyl glycosylphosphotransferase
MLRTYARHLDRAARLADVLFSGLLFLSLLSLSQMQRATGLTQPDAWRLALVGVVAALAWLGIADRLGIYDSQRRKGISDLLVRLGVAALVSGLAVAVAAFLTAAPVARRLPVVFALSQGMTLALLRLPVFVGLRAVRRQGRNYRDVLIVGTGTRAVQVRDSIRRHPEWGLRILGFVDNRDWPEAAALDSERVHKLSEVPDLMRDEVVDEVILGCPLAMLAEIEPLVAVCAEAGVPVTLLSDLFGDLPPPRVNRFGSLSALSFAPVHHSRVELAVKRALDLAGAAALLVLTLPVLAAAAMLIRLTSSGPVLFRQERCGLYGRRFEFLKLRSMQVDADERKPELLEHNEMDGPVFKMKRDPRITPAGQILRKWSIDELPQLWNVLRGDMSLVGPRPPLPDEVDRYSIFERRRLSMRPGITCLWQVGGRNEIGFDEWVKLDLEYIDSWSLLLDAEILLKTVPAVLRGTGR